MVRSKSLYFMKEELSLKHALVLQYKMLSYETLRERMVRSAQPVTREMC